MIQKNIFDDYIQHPHQGEWTHIIIVEDDTGIKTVYIDGKKCRCSSTDIGKKNGKR